MSDCRFGVSPVNYPDPDYPDITKLGAVQRRSARCATRDYQRTSSVTQMIKDLNWRSLEQRRIDSRLTLM